MASNLIQFDSDQLRQIAQLFSAEAQMLEEIGQTLQSAYIPLLEGGWVGEGANEFFEKMDNMMFPNLKKLIAYFANSAESANSAATTIEDGIAYILSKTKS